MGQGERFRPYRVPSTKPSNTQAGQYLPPSLTSVGPPTTQPSGRASKITADTEINGQRPKRARAPRGQGKIRPHRVQLKGDAATLVEWAQRRHNLLESPSYNEALAGRKYIAFSEMAQLTRSDVMQRRSRPFRRPATWSMHSRFCGLPQRKGPMQSRTMPKRSGSEGASNARSLRS